MKYAKAIITITIASVVVFGTAFIPIAKVLKIGSPAPKAELKMTDVSGSSFSLKDAVAENGLLVVFSCNTCPFVIAWEDRYATVAEECKKQKIGMMAVNSNQAKRSGENMDDSMEAMKQHAKEQVYDFLYVLDKNSELALAFGATKTPQIFLFDKDLTLRYTGAIDDNLKEASKVENHYLIDALQNLAAGEEIDPNTTEALGCSIKKIKGGK